MGVIVCAIRGGPDSQATIAKAVALAQETDLPVHFLYVVNCDLLSSASSNYARAISKHIRQMGRAVLQKAQAMASVQGVRARGLVRQGKVGDEIASLCHDLGANYLILGRPQAQTEKNIFSEALLAQFIQRIEKQTGAEVVPPNRDGK
jgi:nucleotide-binding universal stress UspA family protein